MICGPDIFYQIPEWDGKFFSVFGFGSENIPRIIKSLRHVKVSDKGTHFWTEECQKYTQPKM